MNIGAGKIDIERHVKTKKHQANKKDVHKQLKLEDFPTVEQINVINYKVNHALIRYSAFIAEHNIAIRISEHLPKLFRDMFPDSEIAKRLISARTKTTAIINKITGKFNKQNINDILRK